MSETQFCKFMRSVSTALFNKRIDQTYLNRMVDKVNKRRKSRQRWLASISDFCLDPHDLDHAIRIMKKDGHWV